jgi:leader peptidase (prepilin peptidase)/N-methyltransferase
MIDIKYMMVPDSLNLLAIFFAIAGAWSIEGFVENFKNALLFAGGFTLLRFTLSYYLTKKLMLLAEKTKTSWNKKFDRTPFVEAMGEGDIMVVATMGALLGVPLTLVAIFFSALLALPVLLWIQRKNTIEQPRVPYIPFLALATLIVMVFDSPIMRYIEVNY